ncbi:MAG TPA: dienelactone hydrolase family protein [Dehalococcoidia bacterium]|nr:dienelactone hydrolase family protein [Dehalococcoidia bacterium]
MPRLPNPRLLVPASVVAASLLLGIACGPATNHGAAGPATPAKAAAATPIDGAPDTGVSSPSAVATVAEGLPAAVVAGSQPRAGGRTAGQEDCNEASYDSSGSPVGAYLCLPDGAGPWPAVVVLHGAEGPRLNPGYRLIAQGLAQNGFAALQIDYFSQTPGDGAFGNPPAADYLQDAPTWLREIADGISYLQGLPRVDPQRIGVNGYSLGAFMALDAAMLDPRIKAVVEFYGGVVPGFTTNLDQMPPVLMLHGDADALVPVSDAYTLKDLLSSHGRPYEITIYAGAPHGFNFIPGPAQQAARDDAYARMDAFFTRWLRAPDGGP